MTWIVKLKQSTGFKFDPQMKSNLINFVRCQKGKEVLNFGISCLEKDLRNLRNCALSYIIRVVRIDLRQAFSVREVNKNKQRRRLKNDNIHNLLLETRNLTPDIKRLAVNKHLKIWAIKKACVLLNVNYEFYLIISTIKSAWYQSVDMRLWAQIPIHS
jgi:hypothetical protein